MMYKTWDSNKPLEAVLIDKVKKRVNAAWNTFHKELKEGEDIVPLVNGELFMFYKPEDRTMITFNKHKIWWDIESFKEDWLVDFESKNTRPWQFFTELLGKTDSIYKGNE